jgi:hypothetical protein
MQKAASFGLVIALGLILSVVSQGEAQREGTSSERTPEQSEALFFTGSFGLSNNLANPDLNVWHVKCKAKTTICADMFDNFFGDNSGHVSVVCFNPAAQRGEGELEYAIGGTQNPSPSACVTGCLEALVMFQCEFNDFCDTSWDSVIECVNKNFAAGFPVQTQ